MKKFIIALTFMFIFTNDIQSQSNYSSIEDVKNLNYELLQEVGFDDNKINYISRVIYSTVKKSAHLSKKGTFPNKEMLDQQFKNDLLKFLSEEEFKILNGVMQKIK